jgi:hypothetical protein
MSSSPLLSSIGPTSPPLANVLTNSTDLNFCSTGSSSFFSLGTSKWTTALLNNLKAHKELFECSSDGASWSLCLGIFPVGALDQREDEDDDLHARGGVQEERIIAPVSPSKRALRSLTSVSASPSSPAPPAAALSSRQISLPSSPTRSPRTPRVEGVKSPRASGEWCHQCKQKRAHMLCCTDKCPKKYCHRCLSRHYALDARTVEIATWRCPHCLHECTCAYCREEEQRQEHTAAIMEGQDQDDSKRQSNGRPKAKKKKNVEEKEEGEGEGEDDDEDDDDDYKEDIRPRRARRPSTPTTPPLLYSGRHPRRSLDLELREEEKEEEELQEVASHSKSEGNRRGQKRPRSEEDGVELEQPQVCPLSCCVFASVMTHINVFILGKGAIVTNP